MSTTDDTVTGPGTERSAARTVTDVFQPRNLLLAGMLGIGVAAAGDWTGLLWGFLGALCAGLVPAGYIEWERGRGTWGDRHVVDRTKRAPIFLVILGSIGTGSAVMVLGGAPDGILIAMLGLWVMTVVLLAVNTVWKISVDASVASAVVALLAAVHSPWWLIRVRHDGRRVLVTGGARLSHGRPGDRRDRPGSGDGGRVPVRVSGAGRR